MSEPAMMMRPFALKDVRLEDAFWAPRQRVNREVTLPHEYQMCKETGRIDAFRLEWKPGDPNPPHIFWDSDVAKWIEAAAYSLATHPDPELAALVDETVALIQSAQQPDGYLNTHYTVVEPEKRWSNLRDCHELYCAGHLMEAAVALFQATGKRALLDVMCRYADYIGATFGREQGKRRGYPGHEEIELALVKLAEATGEPRYLRLAEYFVDERGRQPHYYDQEALARGDDPKRYWAKDYAYCQAHQPLREQSEVVGHAVRAFYVYTGMADVAARTGDAGLLDACRRLWDDATLRKLYVTGGVGPSHHNEGFTREYDLPNESAYAETCAAIALVFFAHRMVQIEADARYADVMELALYNGTISGVSLDSRRFFYENPLASSGRHHRQDWFGCACCPPNIARLLASIGSYVYSASDTAAYVHLYAAGSGKALVAGQEITLTQETDYPWHGEVTLTVGMETPAEFDLMLRIPGWCREYALAVNGRDLHETVEAGYARLSRTWRNGDRVRLSLAMPVERVVAHPGVAEDAGKVALRRGPVVYCLEQCDHDAPVRAIRLPDGAELSPRWEPELLGGVMVLQGTGLAPAGDWGRALYRPLAQAPERPAALRAVPYCVWDNREPGAMAVWLPRA